MEDFDHVVDVMVLVVDRLVDDLVMLNIVGRLSWVRW